MPPPRSLAENERPCVPVSTPPAVSDPVGGEAKTGSRSSVSVIRARYIRKEAVSGSEPVTARQYEPAPPPHDALSQRSRMPVRFASVTRLAVPNGALVEPTSWQPYAGHCSTT